MRHPRASRAILLGAVLLPLALAACSGPMSAQPSSPVSAGAGAGSSADSDATTPTDPSTDPSTDPNQGDSTMTLPPIMIDVPATEGGLAAKSLVTAGLKDAIVFVVPDGTEADYDAIVSDPAVVSFIRGGDQGGWTARPGLMVSGPGTTDVILMKDGATVIALTVTVLDQPHAGSTTDEPAVPGLPIAPQTQALVDSLPGMSEEDAVAAIQKAGLTARVTARDDEDFPITMDYRTDRIDLEIADGKVTRATIG